MVFGIKIYTLAYFLLGDKMFVVKYLKSLLYILVPVIVLSIITSILYYFNILNSKGVNYINLIMIALSMLLGGIYIGTKADKKGWLEGIKVGLEVIVILFIVSFLAFDKGMNIKTLIYYFILVASSTLGGMIGINRKKKES